MQSKGIIFLKAVRNLLDPVDNAIERIPYDVVCGTLDGDVIRARVVCTSSNFQNDTFNFKFIDSGEIRTVHASLLMEINGKEVML
jgi:hypothetical protein